MQRWLASTVSNNLWKMQVIRLCLWMHFFAAVLVPFFREWAGLSYTQIFVLNAWFMLWNFLLEVPTGTIADVFGRKTSIVLSALVAVAGRLLYASVPNFHVFLVAEAILAASMTLSSGADEALVYDTLVELGRREQAQAVFARLDSFKLGGIVLGALLGGPMAALWGLRAPVLLQAIPTALAAVCAFTLAEPGGRTASRSLSDYARTLRSGVLYLHRHATLRVLTADMVGSATLAWLIIWLYQPQLERVGVGIAAFGLVHAAMCLTQIGVLTNLAPIERFLGSKRRYLIFSAVLPGAAYLGLAVSGQAPVVVALIVVAAGFGLTRPTVFLGFMNAHIPSEQRATILSTVSMVRTLAVALVNPLAGVLSDWWMAGALVVFGVAVFAVALVTGVSEAHLEAPESAQAPEAD